MSAKLVWFEGLSGGGAEGPSSIRSSFQSALAARSNSSSESPSGPIMGSRRSKCPGEKGSSSGGDNMRFEEASESSSSNDEKGAPGRWSWDL